MTTTLIERGAIALLREDNPKRAWARIGSLKRHSYLRRSRICLEAFLVPTSEMVSEGVNAYGMNPDTPDEEVESIYHAMVNAELETDT